MIGRRPDTSYESRRTTPCDGAPPGALPLASEVIWTLLAQLAAPGVSLDDIASMRDVPRMYVHRDRGILVAAGLLDHERFKKGTYRATLTEVEIRRRVTPM